MIEKRNWITVILLNLVTCGIYAMIFLYKYGEDVNKVCEGDGKNTMNYFLAMLLGIVTCGIYNFIWFYGIGARLEEAGKRYGVNCQSAIVYLLIMFVPFYGYYYLCDNMNQFADKVCA